VEAIAYAAQQAATAAERTSAALMARLFAG